MNMGKKSTILLTVFDTYIEIDNSYKAYIKSLDRALQYDIIQGINIKLGKIDALKLNSYYDIKNKNDILRFRQYKSYKAQLKAYKVDLDFDSLLLNNKRFCI